MSVFDSLLVQLAVAQSEAAAPLAVLLIRLLSMPSTA